MDKLTLLLLSQLVFHRPPGKSPYSLEEMHECGRDRAAPACALERVCDEPAFWCAAPRYSASRGFWARVETRETGLERYADWSELVVSTVRRLTRCTDAEGVADESCVRVRWWRGSKDLTLVVAVLSVFEAGMAEGPMYGHPPLGRGADGEVCALGLMPEYAPRYAMWLPAEERKRLSEAPYREVEAWALAELHGPHNLGRCIEVAIREIVAWRRICKSDAGMFAGYAAGRCGHQGKTVMMRTNFLNRMRRSTPPLPTWAAEQLGVQGAGAKPTG